MLTPETITRHELTGLPVRVADAASADFVGIGGRVVSESMRTLTVRTPSGDKQVPKQGTTFEFRLAETPSVSGGGQSPGTDEQAGEQLPACTDECGDAETSPYTDECGDAETSPYTDEAAGRRKASGSTSELGSDTAGVRPRQSGPSGDDTSGVAPASQRGECEGVVYVTVDGTRLLSRPAERTDRGVQSWR